MRAVVLQLFTMSGRPRVEVMDWIMGEMLSLPNSDITPMYQSLRGNSMLPHARNSAVATFLTKTQATDLIMIDDDNYGEAGSLEKLLSHKVDVVGAPCRRKLAGDEKWPIRWHADRPLKLENGLIDVESTGTGILRMSRHCIEQMVMSVKQRCYDDAVAGTAWPVFEYAVHDNSWYGEDVEFCRRWRELGGAIYIDPSIVTHHIGDRDYTGSPLEYVKGLPPLVQIALPKVTVANELSNG